MAPGFMAIAAYAFQMKSASPVWPNMVMIMLATATHMGCMMWRDAEFRALTAAHGLNARDVFARVCTACFDALLLFGLISGAGYNLFWPTYQNIAAVLLLAMPVVTLLQLRKHYAPALARDGFGPALWLPPIYLLALVVLLWANQAVLVASGNQPYVVLVMLSVVMIVVNRGFPVTPEARLFRYAAMAGGGIIFVWNYLNIG